MDLQESHASLEYQQELARAELANKQEMIESKQKMIEKKDSIIAGLREQKRKEKTENVTNVPPLCKESSAGSSSGSAGDDHGNVKVDSKNNGDDDDNGGGSGDDPRDPIPFVRSL